MKDISDYMNYAFEIYSHDGKLLDRIDGPGFMSPWLNDFRTTAPERLAFIPASFAEASKKTSSDRLWRAVMIPVESERRDTGGKRIEAVMFATGIESEARSLAKELGCAVYCWSWREETRSIIIADATNEKDYPESD